MMRRLTSLLAGVLLPGAFLLVGVAQAQVEAVDVRIRSIEFQSGNETRLVVSVSGPAVQGDLPAEAFTVTEEGIPVESFDVVPLSSQPVPVSVALLMDTSRSTRDKLGQAVGAAKGFIDQLPANARVNIIAFGSGVSERLGFTSLGGGGRDSVLGALDGLATDQNSGTSLYDAVVLATQRLQLEGAQHNVVIFSDGADSGSNATLVEATDALERAQASTTAVLLTTGGVDVAALRTIADAVQGGAFLGVEDTGGLETAFARTAQALSSQYVITYTSNATEPADLDFQITVSTNGQTGTDQSVVTNRRAEVGPAAPPEPSGPLVPAFGSRIGLTIGILAAFLGVFIFLALLLWRPEGRRAEQLLARGLRLYTRSAKDKAKKKGAEGMFGGTAVGRAAVGIAEKVPRSKQFDENLQRQLDQAGWPLRSTEFMLFHVLGFAAGALLGFGLFQSPLVGIMLSVLGVAAPRLALAQRMAKRQSEFLEQLPDTLQLLAGSLQAGYGFLQAIDTVAREANPPTSTEFARVLSEARLGMPLEDALDAMADRVGGEDFKWVVLAINIQRQVGGNLAALLTTVSNTLREREMVRRQIKVLSAEGRLSAVILVALPFVLVGYLSIVNPGYMSQLTGSTAGKISIVISLVLIGIGVVWMRKIIRIDV